MQYFPGGGRIDGNYARDTSQATAQWEVGTNAAALPTNMVAADTSILQAGLLMGKITTGGKYRNSIIGAIGTAITAGTATSITVPAALAKEVARLITLAAGNVSLSLIGPPTATGTVAVTAVTCTAASGTTLTISSVSLPACTADSFICPADGSQYPITFIDELDGIRVADATGSLQCQFPRIPVAGGVVNVASIINYPTSSSLKTWIKSMLNSAGAVGTGAGGRFSFSDDQSN